MKLNYNQALGVPKCATNVYKRQVFFLPNHHYTEIRGLGEIAKTSSVHEALSSCLKLIYPGCQF